MAGQLTTHVLDTMLGHGAKGLRAALSRISPDPAFLGEEVMDDRGRGAFEGVLERGVYELQFHVAAYHRGLGVVLPDPPFLDQVAIRFGVSEAGAHYHVPLLVSPYGYSTYRGS
jgi:5-hydroxyisourate hydrolase